MLPTHSMIVSKTTVQIPPIQIPQCSVSMSEGPKPAFLLDYFNFAETF